MTNKSRRVKAGKNLTDHPRNTCYIAAHFVQKTDSTPMAKKLYLQNSEPALTEQLISLLEALFYDEDGKIELLDLLFWMALICSLSF